MNISYYRNLVILAGIGPLLMLGWDTWQGQLGANGVNNALHITGILSLVFLFISLIVTPLRTLTGWNSLIAYRRALGLYGFAYAALHFGIYVVFDRMGSVSSTVEEIFSRRFLLVGFIAVMLMLPLALTSTNAMIRKLGPMRWKLLHRLAYVAAVLGVVHYYMLVKSDVRQPLAFAAVLTPILGFRSVKHYLDLRRGAAKAKINAVAAPTVARKFWNGDLVVANIRRETNDVKTFRFVMPGGGEIPFVHQPGQYMNLTLNIDGTIVKRSYTIASSPTQRGHVELTIKRNPEGTASRFMHDVVKAGDSIRVGAPAGKFFFNDLKAEAVVLISGGVGITPLMSILRNLTDQAWGGTIYFINAVRSAEDMIFANELEFLANRFENLQVLNFFSQSLPKTRNDVPASRWQDKSGYINAEDLGQFISDLEDLPIFLCGPDAMMQAVRKTIVSLGIPNENVSTEEFVSPKATAVINANDQVSDGSIGNLVSGLADGQTATITFSTSARMVEIDSSTTVLEAAEQVGVTLPWECRSGICGQCKVRCASGRVRMVSRDAITKSEESEGFILACQSHPVDESIVIEI
ncbi:FAD-binding oxidoreductase [Neorhodopirellula pilleata]|nr:ferric reductase-like transmembrane domain-containing protein [Neorhodopirellula pilleata]